MIYWVFFKKKKEFVKFFFIQFFFFFVSSHLQICLNSKVVKVIASSSNQCKEDSNACLIEEKIWTLILENGTEVKSRSVINCGGLYGDHVDGLIDPQPSFTIHPRKGQFAVFDKQASKYLTSIICPVPTERTKGVFLFPTGKGDVACFIVLFFLSLS